MFSIKSSFLPRRRFLGQVGCYAGSLALGGITVAKGAGKALSANGKMNIAVIGVGGRGATDLAEVGTENIVAICDVHEKHLGAAAERHPDAKKFADFRKLFDVEKSFDAVMVATTEHTHAFAVLPALRLGKHVYCEKPLAHTVHEARFLAEEATKAGVVTQMGTQMHAQDNFRRVVELIQGNAIGPVKEAHVWVSRAWGDGERPKEVETVPSYLDWDLWLGPAPKRPFHSSYIEGRPKWYKFWDFGGGTLPDLGSHWNDLAFWALSLRHPISIEAQGPPVSAETAPASFQVTYEYGARGKMPPLKHVWYQGENKPEHYHEKTIPQWENGVLFVGSRGMLLADYHRRMLLPEKDFAGFEPPAPHLSKSAGHWKEWLLACKGTGRTLCDFNYSGALTEANHLGNIAFRTGKKIQWDHAKLRAKNCPEADGLIRKTYRDGWSLA
jgi:predicted dehydrogenase